MDDKTSGFLILLSLANVVCAQSAIPSLIPEAYSDSYALIDGKPAPEGTNVTVRSAMSNEFFGTGLVADDTGIFSVDIIFDNPLSEADEGATNFEPVTWCVNGFEATAPARGEDKAESGELNMYMQVNLNTSVGKVSCVREPGVFAGEIQAMNKSPSFLKVIVLFLILVILVLTATILKMRKTKNR